MKKLLLPVLMVLFATQVFAGSFYRINGIIDFQDDKVVFNTEDCRVFLLEISDSAARKFDGKTVQIDAVAKDATRVGVLKVKKIRPFNKRIFVQDPKPYKNYQKPAGLLKSDKSKVVLKNIRWERMKEKDAAGDPQFHWRKVTIRPELIDKAYFVIKPFPPEWIAAHSLMLFTFKKGGMVDEQGNESRGLVLTIEAHQRKDQKYSLQDGMKKAFGIIWLLTTWENYAAETCHFEKKKMIPYEIKFNNAQNQALLLEAIKQSVVNRSGEYYHTTRNNCTNNLVVLLDKIAKTKIKFWAIPNMIYNVRATMPVMVPKYLQKKGLLKGELPEVTEKTFFADPDEIFKY